MAISDADKRRIVDLATDHLQAVGDGDPTLALAGLYAAAQALERVLLERRVVADVRALYVIQVVAKRVGAAMTVVVDEETFLPRRDVQ